MTAVTLYSAEDTLARMLTIVEANRLVRGEYVSDDVDQERIDAPCGGHRACAVGSLVLAAGFTIDPDTGDVRADQDPDFTIDLSTGGASQWPHGRDGFMRRHREVGRAYSALNQAAAEYANEHEHELGGVIVQSHGELEALFESDLLDAGDDDHDHLNMPPTVTDAMSDIVQRAQRILAKDAA